MWLSNTVGRRALAGDEGAGGVAGTVSGVPCFGARCLGLVVGALSWTSTVSGCARSIRLRVQKFDPPVAFPRAEYNRLWVAAVMPLFHR